PAPVGSLAASQAILAWSTNGWIIGLAMSGHTDKVDISQTHHTLTSGVIAHDLSYHADFDAGSWLLVSQEASFAGRGRIHGRGEVFDESGRLVASFTQESMLKEAGDRRGAL